MSAPFFPIVIHHNPDCGTSRNVLDLIRAAGHEPTIIAYLETGWTRPQLQALFAAAGLTAREAFRTTKSPAEELGLLDPMVNEQALLTAMIEHPRAGQSSPRRDATSLSRHLTSVNLKSVAHHPKS